MPNLQQLRRKESFNRKLSSAQEANAQRILHLASLILILFVVTGSAVSQDRITSAIDSTQTMVLKGSVSPRAKAELDHGPVDPSMKLTHVTMMFKPSATQQVALDRFLAEQQDPNSPNFHNWLTPEQYGERFGLSSADTAKIVRWLKSQGLTIVEVARGRNWIAFSGTAAQMQLAFRTQIHRFQVDGEEHFANANEASIPKALNGVVAGLRGLDNFKMKPLMVRKSTSVSPLYTDSNGNTYLAPDDIATIYDVTPLYQAGIDGTGMKIAIIGQTDVHMTDIENFRAGFNLSSNDPTSVLATGCADPGFTGDEGEADLDLEWSGALARNAKITFIVCDNNNGGVIGSLVYAVNNNTAPVVSMSYGNCESNLGQSFAQQYEPFLQQANAQGQTVLVSSGDSGSATCDSSGSSQAIGGLAVNGLASPPEITAVGGTEFDGDVNNPNQYWNFNNGTNGGSAVSYIPELAWDDSSAGTTLQTGVLASSGGGASIFFTKPAFQSGPGVPSDGARDLPDVAMPAAVAHDGYIFCTQGSCANGIDNAVANGSLVGGTSVACPVFAGIVALLNQSLRNAPPAGLGNINTTLYSYAQSTPGAFHDVPAGNYSESGNPSGNMEPCQIGTPNCTNGIMGFQTTAGYDQVTGLGSVDANVFVNNWPSSGSSKTPTTAAATVSPAIAALGATVTLSATVKPTSGSGSPTGTVSFFNGTSEVGTPVTLSSGAASLSYNTGSLGAGTYSITASYSGDGNFAASVSVPATLTISATVNPTTTSIAISANPSVTQDDVGSTVTFTATVGHTAGAAPPTGTVTFSSGGTVLGTGTLNGSGSATYSTSTLTANQYSVTAAYAGDANYSSSSSAVATLDVVDFQIAANPATVSVSSPGQSGSTTLSITSLGGFNQALSYSCSGLPAAATCSFSTTSTGATVTIATMAPVASRDKGPVQRGQGLYYALLLPGLLGAVLAGSSKRSLRGMRLMALLCAVAFSSLGIACSGASNSGGNNNGGGSTGTPTGQSTVIVTASAGSLSHQTTITLNVQ